MYSVFQQRVDLFLPFKSLFKLLTGLQKAHSVILTSGSLFGLFMVRIKQLFVLGFFSGSIMQLQQKTSSVIANVITVDPCKSLEGRRVQTFSCGQLCNGYARL